MMYFSPLKFWVCTELGPQRTAALQTGLYIAQRQCGDVNNLFQSLAEFPNFQPFSLFRHTHCLQEEKLQMGPGLNKTTMFVKPPVNPWGGYSGTGSHQHPRGEAEGPELRHLLVRPRL